MSLANVPVVRSVTAKMPSYSAEEGAVLAGFRRMKLNNTPYWCSLPEGSTPETCPLKYHHSCTLEGCGPSSIGNETADVGDGVACAGTSSPNTTRGSRTSASHLAFFEE